MNELIGLAFPGIDNWLLITMDLFLKATIVLSLGYVAHALLGAQARADEGDTLETIAELRTKQRGKTAEIVVVSPVKSIGSTSWIVYGCVALVAIATLAVSTHRRRRTASAQRRADSDTTPC